MAGETSGAVVGMPFRFDSDDETQVPVVKVAGNISLGDVAITTNESAGVDSDSNELPANFDSYAQVLGYTSGALTSITVTVGADTYVQTLSYDGDGNLTGVSMWVKQ